MRCAANTGLTVKKTVAIVDGSCAGAAGVLAAITAKDGCAEKVVSLGGHSNSKAVRCIAQAVARTNDVTRQVTFVPSAAYAPEKAAVLVALGCWDPFAPLSLCHVLQAAEEWLDPATGVVVPSSASLFISALDCAATHAARASQFLGASHGVSLGAVKEAAFNEVSRELVPKESIVTVPCKLAELFSDAKSALSDLEMPFKLPLARAATIHGFCLHHDLAFPPLPGNSTAIGLSTAPGQPATRYKQLCLYLLVPVVCSADAVIAGSLRISSSSTTPSQADFHLTAQVSTTGQRITNTFYL
jgi:hypothetical protein